MTLGKVGRSFVMAVLLVGVSIVGSSCAQKQKPVTEEGPPIEQKPKVEAQKEVPPPATMEQPTTEQGPMPPVQEEGKVKKHKTHKHVAKERHGKKAHEEAEAGGATVYATLKSRGTFTVFLKALKQAGMSKTLRGKGPFTILAPTDKAANIEALKSKSGAKLQDVVESHILKGKIKSGELDNVKSVQTWNGHTLHVSKHKGVIHVGRAGIIREDIVCSNGVIQVVDAVITPKGEAAEHKKQAETKTKKKK
jgi:uncharacterized surface protein with fasciclin (FAS1) repeats